MSFLLYPYLLLRFWYVESPMRILKFFWYLNLYVFHLLSVPLFLRTFFKPAKLEYRKGLIGISIIIGMMFKSVLLFVDFIIIVVVFAFEIVFFLTFLLYPVIPLFLVFRT